ncbi:MAG: hypothetical protein K6A44_04755 [bacterium]|nr:hypothetical protein [bacterium]
MANAVSAVSSPVVTEKKDGMVTIKASNGATINIEESLFANFKPDVHEYWYQEKKDASKPECLAFFGDKISLKNGLNLYYKETTPSNPGAVITIKKDSYNPVTGQGIDIAAENADRILIDAAKNHTKDFIRFTKFHGSICDCIEKNPDDNVCIESISGEISHISGISETLDSNYFEVVDGVRVTPAKKN